MLDFYYGLPGMTQLTRKFPIALGLILREFPGTNDLMSLLKDRKENLLLKTFYSISEVRLSASLVGQVLLSTRTAPE